MLRPNSVLSTWLGYRWNEGMLTFLLSRVSALLVAGYLVTHVLVLSGLEKGGASFNRTLHFLTQPLFRYLEIGLIGVIIAQAKIAGSVGGHLTGLLYAVRLTPDLAGTSGERVLCVKADQDWELVTTPGFMASHCNEGAFVVLHDGTYYLTYSSGFYADPRYGIGYATSPTPLGPWTKSPTNPIAATDRALGVSGPGHGSITICPDGSGLFLVYHAHADPANPSGSRTVNIDRLVFDAQGTLRLLGPTRTPQPLPAGAEE